MKLIVGLGNPGKEYESTRHNVGFWLIDWLSISLDCRLEKKKFDGIFVKKDKFILLKPISYMNNSGICIKKLIDYYKIEIKDILVFYDDIYLPVGKIRFKRKSSGGSHNGVKSIVENLNDNNFKQIKVGVGYDKNFLIKDWVLGKFSEDEKKRISENKEIIVYSILRWINDDIDCSELANNLNSKT